MGKVVPYKPRQHQKASAVSSFPKTVAVAMLVSFGIGLSTAHLIGDDAAVAQPAVTSGPVVAVYGTGSHHPQPVALSGPRTTAAYKLCVGSVRVNCVVDGDTFWSNGVKIRVADIDTPEVSRPRCAAEKALGDRATGRLLQLVNAGPFQMRAWPGRDEDKYGRKLRVLVRDGRSIGDILVSEGLARTWSGKRQPWC
jgi:micrococcal nuclease